MSSPVAPGSVALGPDDTVFTPGPGSARPALPPRLPNALGRALASPAAVWVVLAVGVALRVWTYLMRSELWLDEVAIVRNVNERGLWQLLATPLDFGQAAPKGFLLVEWVLSRAFGTSEYVFRFVPAAASVWALFLIRDVARRVFTGIGVTTVLLLVGVGPVFLNFTPDVKQYTLDMVVAFLLIRQAIDVDADGFSRRRVLAIAATGAIGVWFSQYAIFVVAALGIVLGVMALRRFGAAGAVRRLAPLAAAWIPAAALAAWVSLHSVTPAASEYLRWFHASNMGPKTFAKLNDRIWFWRMWRGQLRLFHGWWTTDDIAWVSIFPTLAVTGLVALAARARKRAWFLLAPFLVVLAASFARQYPQTVRLVLPSIVILLFGVAEFAEQLSTLSGRALRAAGTVVALLLCVPPVVAVVRHPPPNQLQQIGESLRAVRARWQPGDKLYVPEGLAMPFLYYAPKFGFQPADYVVAPCGFKDRKPMYRAADRLRGQPRVWALAEEATFGGQVSQRYLARLGVQRDSILPEVIGSPGEEEARTPYGRTTIRLFDLSDTLRYAGITAETFRPSRYMPGKRMADPHWCYGVFQPLVKESEGTRRPKA